MRIKREHIGKVHYCKMLKTNVTIEEGQEDLYKKAGMSYLFEEEKEFSERPIKKKYRGNNNDSDNKGTGEHSSTDS